jgi:hypothetical protein
MGGIGDTLDFGMFSAEARWERIASGLFWTAWIFVAMTAYALYSRDDWQGVVMTAAPAGVVFALWWLARARAEFLLTSVRPPTWVTIASTLVIVGGAGGAAALLWQWSHPRVVYVRDPHQAVRVNMSNLETIEKEVTLANGDKVMMTTLSRKKRPDAECEQWSELIRAPDGSGERRYCLRWGAATTAELDREVLSETVGSPLPPKDPTTTAPEGCEEWVRKPDATGEMIGYCARWAAKAP